MPVTDFLQGGFLYFVYKKMQLIQVGLTMNRLYIQMRFQGIDYT